MRKQLSQLLIITLLFLSPLSFSTDKIPDFKPTCDVQVTDAKRTTIVAHQSSGIPPKRLLIKTPPGHSFTSTIFAFTIDWFRTILFGRAPPSLS